MTPSPDANTLDAARLGTEVLEALRDHPPYFLPMARALIFYSSTRVGLGIGFEHGTGFMITRFVCVLERILIKPMHCSRTHVFSPTPYDACIRLPSSISASTHAAWSAPCYLVVDGVEWGAFAGAEHICALIGVMSEQALHDLVHGNKLIVGADFSAYIGPTKPSGQVLWAPSVTATCALLSLKPIKIKAYIIHIP